MKRITELEPVPPDVPRASPWLVWIELAVMCGLSLVVLVRCAAG